MPAERFPHLFLPGPEKREDYSSPRRGGESPRLRAQDRPTHAAHVRQRLEDAWRQAEHRQAVAHADRDGVYLEFSSEPGFDLLLKSLEAQRSGIRLLNVKKDGPEGSETTRATVFVPQSKRTLSAQGGCYANRTNGPRRMERQRQTCGSDQQHRGYPGRSRRVLLAGRC